MGQLVGVFGGTFDPIHYGHLRPALEVLQQAGLSQIRFIPNRLPPHRAKPRLNELQRADLIQVAIAETPQFVLDTCELQRKGPSFMVDTLQHLKQQSPANTLCLMLGMDAFYGLPQWHRWQAILELCHIIVTTRPGESITQPVSWPTELQRLSDDPLSLLRRPEGQILLQSVTQLDISASQIRGYLSSGQSTQYLLPETVREIIEQAYDE